MLGHTHERILVDHITEPARDVAVYSDVDVLVVGGGPTGVAAAVGAARAGARTLLIEHHGFLGGMWTAGMVLTLAGFNSWLRPYDRCVEGIAGEWIHRAAEAGGATIDRGFVINSDPETMKRVADELITEAGVEVLFHTWGCTPLMDGDRVAGAFIENVDGRHVIRAGATIDCTGNGDMAARSGAAWVKAAALQPMTMPFRMAGARLDPNTPHDPETILPIGPDAGLLSDPILTEFSSVRRDVPVDHAAMRAAREAGELPMYGGPWFGGLEKEIVWVNSTRIVGDASDAKDLSRAEIEGRRDSQAIAGYLREHVPGLEGTWLMQTSTQIGVRETRRLDGEHVLTGDEVRDGAVFEDSIGVGCWPIDIHPTEKVVGTHAMFVPAPFDLPYRMLLPQGVDGLLVAGRCASTDRDALGSVRVGATCAAMGHAAGVAAAVAVRDGVRVRDADVPEVQRILIEQGAIISAAQVRAASAR